VRQIAVWKINVDSTFVPLSIPQSQRDGSRKPGTQVPGNVAGHFRSREATAGLVQATNTVSKRTVDRSRFQIRWENGVIPTRRSVFEIVNSGWMDRDPVVASRLCGAEFSFPGLASQAIGCGRVATENTLQCNVEEKLETGICRTAQAPPRSLLFPNG